MWLSAGITGIPSLATAVAATPIALLRSVPRVDEVVPSPHRNVCRCAGLRAHKFVPAAAGGQTKLSLACSAVAVAGIRLLALLAGLAVTVIILVKGATAAIRAPTAEVGGTAGAGAAAFSLDLAEGVSMKWRLDPAASAGGKIVADVNMAYTGGGWLAFGVAKVPQQMIGGIALIGQPGIGAVQWFDMLSKSSAGVVLNKERTVDPATKVGHENGVTTLDFRFEPSGPGEVEILWAHGGGSPTLSMHVARGSARVDFRTGASNTSSGVFRRQMLLWLHILLMLGGWGLVLPAGVLAATLRHHVDSWAGKNQGSWFAYHTKLQYAGTGMGMLGAASAWLMVGPGGHLATPHAIIGATVTVWAALQLLNGLNRPKVTLLGQTPTATRMAWERLHKQGGKLLLALAWMNLLYGTLYLPRFGGYASGSLVSWGVLGAVLVTMGGVIYLRNEIVRRFRR